MGKLHTHYDNLQVTRIATSEVIRAAYKTLTQKYHPDRHHGNANADRVMALINESYQVLSDPVKRAAHDQWIEQQEQLAKMISQHPANSSTQPQYEQSSAPISSQAAANHSKGRLISHLLKNWVLYGFLGLFIWAWTAETLKKPSVGPKPYTTTPSVLPEIERPIAAPNGQPWPLEAGYVKGYKQLLTNGLSTVTVDNSQNDSDVFVKLVSLDGAQAYPVRQFYIPALGSFTLKKITAGRYDVRYRDLSSGGLSRSEAVTLIELHSDAGVQFSNMTMTLYKVKNGNMQTFGLSEAEF